MTSLREFYRRFVSCVGRSVARPSVSRTEIDFKEMKKAMPEGFIRWRRLDKTYYAPEREEFRSAILRDITQFLAYEEAVFDCENFAMHFAGTMGRDYGINTVGVVIDNSETHAYNVVVYDDLSVDFIEPNKKDPFVNADVDYERESWEVIM